MSPLTVSKPVGRSERMAALDVLRGVALCGILLVHIHAMGQSWIRDWPPFPPSLWKPDWQIYLINQVFLEGAMRGLFTLLFGAGLLLMTARDHSPEAPIQVADIYLRRSIGLMGFGILNAVVLLYPGDILFFYGVCGLILFTFRHVKSRFLVAISMGLLVAVTAPQALLAWRDAHHVHQGDVALAAQERRAIVTPDQQHAIEARQTTLDTYNPRPDQLARETKARRGGWLTATLWSIESWSGGAFGLPGAVMISQSLAYMMLGMVLLRSNVLNGMQSSRFYFSLAAGGYLLGMAMRGLRLWLLWRADFSPLVWQPTLIYELARLPLTLGHMGLILALWRLHRDGWVSKIFAALGQMALTNYLGQTLLTSLVFYGLSLYDGFNAYGLWLISLGIWVMQAMFSLWWLNRYRFGPVEWMLRSIAYGVRQPMRR